MATPTDISLLAAGNCIMEANAADTFPEGFFASSTGLNNGIVRVVPTGYTDFAVDDIVVYRVDAETQNESFVQNISDTNVTFFIVKTENIIFKYTPPIIPEV